MTELRFSLLAAAAVLLRVAHRHILHAPYADSPLFVVTFVVTSGAALAIFGYAALGRVSPRARWLILLAALIDILLGGVLLSQRTPQAVLTTEMLLVVAAYMFVLILIFLNASPQHTPLILVPLLVGDNQLILTVIQSEITGSIWALILVIMILIWRRPGWRAILFGCALALQSYVLLLLPILWIRLYWTDEARLGAVRRFTLWAAAAWVLITLPIVMTNPELWWGHVRDSWGLIDGLHGHGLAALAEYGLLPLSPESVRLAAAFIYSLGLWLLHRHYTTLERASWMFPAALLWMLPNTPDGAWLLWLTPTAAALFRELPARLPLPLRRPSRTLAYALGAATLVIGIGVLLLIQQPRRLEVSLHYPIGVDGDGRMVEIPVEVTNISTQDVMPQFAITPWIAGLPQHWAADTAANVLAPNSSALFRLRNPEHGFYSMAQGRVEDGLGGQATQFTVGPFLDYGFPDSIYNPDFQFWSLEHDVPLGWVVQSQPPFAANTTPIEVEGRRGVALHLDALSNGLNLASLNVGLIFPLDPIGYWVYFDPPEGVDPTSLIYGVEFQSGSQRILLLHGSAAQPPVITSSLYVARRAVEPRTWVYQEVDVAALYAEAGWALPEPQRFIFRDIEADLIPLNLRLTLGVTGPVGQVSGIFGPIVQSSRYVDPARLMRETFTQPAAYYARLAQNYLSERNYHHAVTAYETALGYAPDDGTLLAGLEQARGLAEARLPWWESG